MQGMLWKYAITDDQRYLHSSLDDEPSFVCEEHFNVSGWHLSSGLFDDNFLNFID